MAQCRSDVSGRTRAIKHGRSRRPKDPDWETDPDSDECRFLGAQNTAIHMPPHKSGDCLRYCLVYYILIIVGTHRTLSMGQWTVAIGLPGDRNTESLSLRLTANQAGTFGLLGNKA
ncbi:GM23002 [Drosophila sechellia]|uniref:GM23002 n=1 Tax=Drosophila sechellia TaxID=7238 RepID=B4I7D8_DROSE|nr:GM23002 [Drosophila sechellia]